MEFQSHCDIPDHILLQNVSSPKEYFELLFSEETMVIFVKEINAYADDFFDLHPALRKTGDFKYWKEVTANDIKAYLGLIIYMGFNKLPQIRDYWKNSSLYRPTFCSDVMSRTKFFLLNKFFHIADNKNSNTSNKLYKLRTLLWRLISNWQKHYQLCREVTIDERMVPFRGRIKFKHFMKEKPIK